MRCRASLGRAVRIIFAPRLGCVCVGCLILGGTTGGIASIMCGAWIIPGVLFWVTRQWSLGVISNTHLAVGFCDFMMGLALVSCGIVMMTVSSITLFLIHMCHATYPHPPFVHLEYVVVLADNWSKCLEVWVSASPWEWYLLQQCAWSIHQWGCAGVDGESMQVIDNDAEIIPSIRKYGKPLYLGCNNGHIGNDLLKGQDRRRLQLRTPMSGGCPHLCIPPLCTRAGQAGICSNHMCHLKFCMPTPWDWFATCPTCWGCPGPGG